MTQSPTEAWLKEAEEAAKKHITGLLGYYDEYEHSDYKDMIVAGAQWQRERSAPDKQELASPSDWEKLWDEVEERVINESVPHTNRDSPAWEYSVEDAKKGFDAAVEQIARPPARENERLRKALKVAWAWIKERRDVSFGNMEGADGPEFKQWEELYSISCKALEEIRKAREGK